MYINCAYAIHLHACLPRCKPEINVFWNTDMWVFCICSKGLCLVCICREAENRCVCTYVCVCVQTEIYMYIWRERERSFQKTFWLKGKAVEYKICFKDKETTRSWGVIPHTVLIICFFLAHQVYSGLSRREMSLHSMNEKQTKLDFITIFMGFRGYVLKWKLLGGSQSQCPQHTYRYQFGVPGTLARLAVRPAPAWSHTFTRYQYLRSHSRHRKHGWNRWKKSIHAQNAHREWSLTTFETLLKCSGCMWDTFGGGCHPQKAGGSSTREIRFWAYNHLHSFVCSLMFSCSYPIFSTV